METSEIKLDRFTLSLQSFEDLRKRNYIYVDKTDYVYRLVNQGKSYFLARPRRFGKSLMCNTLRAYFEGKKELFEGLKIAQWEKDWVKYPILYLDFSNDCYSKGDSLRSLLFKALENLGKTYGIDVSNSGLSLSMFCGRIVSEIKNKTGLQTVLIIDDYDNPMINSVNPDEDAKIYREFFTVLKSHNECFRFVFMTGVTRCSKVLYYDGNPHWVDISSDTQFSAVCGITHQELTCYFKDDIRSIAEKENVSFETIVSKLDEWYGGYLFHESGTKVFNTARLFSALNYKCIRNYWQSTDSAEYLATIFKKSNFDIKEDLVYTKDFPFTDDNLLSLLFFYGYITIKSYDDEYRLYTMGITNIEAKKEIYKIGVSFSSEEKNIVDWKVAED